MKSLMIWEIACMIYAKILRDLLVEAVDNPDREWDNVVLRVVDSIFDYQG